MKSIFKNTRIIGTLFLLCNVQQLCAFQHLLPMGQELYVIATNMAEATTTVNTSFTMVNIELRSPQTELGKLMKQFIKLMDVINGLEEKIDMGNTSNVIETFGGEYLLAVKLFNWEGLQDEIRAINSKFDNFLHYINRKENNIVWLVSNGTDIGINQTVFTEFQMNFFDTVSNEKFLKTTSCTGKVIRQHFLQHVVEKLIIFGMKLSAMSIFTTIVWHVDEDWRARVRQLANELNDDFEWYVFNFGYIIEKKLGDLDACDSPDRIRIRGETYFEIENLEQVVVFQYESLGRSSDCDNAITKGLFTFDKKHDFCKGNMSDCKYSGWLHVCRIENSPKRYEWIKAEDGIYGMNFDKCPNGKISEYEGFNNWMYSHCICKCRPSGQTNWISLNWVMTNVTNNMVVIGLRFVLEHWVLHIQVKQGKLMANGIIDPSSQNWIPLSKNVGMTGITVNKKFHLGHVYLPADYVAVGVKFDHGVSIRVVGRKINYLTGQILPDSIERYVHHAKDKLLVLPRRNSINTNLSHTKVSDKNWIKLRISNLKHDAGQSMLPLFDGVAVEPDPPLPIGGIGMIHKGVKGYAGYISMRLSLFDFGTFYHDLFHKLQKMKIVGRALLESYDLQ